MAKVHVLCSYVLEVEVPDDPEYDAHFDLVENHCPGTGRVGSALDAVMDRCDESRTCWACTLGGACEILSDDDERLPPWMREGKDGD